MESEWKNLETYFQKYDYIQLNSSRYLKMLKFHIKQTPPNSKVLDAGAGTGILTEKLVQKGNQVTSVDINKFALKFLKNKVENKAQILEYDLSKEINFDQKFDVINSMIVLPFPNNVEKFLDNLYNNLNNKGKIVLSSWNCVEDIYKGAIEILEDELEENKKLEDIEVKGVWKDIKENGKNFSEEIKNKKLTLDRTKKYLTKIGFKNIKTHKSMYNNRYTFHITAEK